MPGAAGPTVTQLRLVARLPPWAWRAHLAVITLHRSRTLGKETAIAEVTEALVCEAYETYLRGDPARILELVHPDLDWTYLDPGFENPPPQTCHGRLELQWALERQTLQGLPSEIEEVASNGDKVMVVIHTPGIDQLRVRQGDDRNYMVLTMRDGLVVAMRACRDREEARIFAGLEGMA